MKSFEEEMLGQQVINFANWSRLDNTISLLPKIVAAVLHTSPPQIIPLVQTLKYALSKKTWDYLGIFPKQQTTSPFWETLVKKELG